MEGEGGHGRLGGRILHHGLRVQTRLRQKNKTTASSFKGQICFSVPPCLPSSLSLYLSWPGPMFTPSRCSYDSFLALGMIAWSWIFGPSPEVMAP